MTTNTHILNMNELLNEVKFTVREWHDSESKNKILNLLDCSLDELMQMNTEYSNRMQQVNDLMARVSTLSRSLYEPVLSAQFVYPEEGDYNAVRQYVDQRKEQDCIFKQYCANHSRKQLCERLSDEFGWIVDVKSYGRNLQRH